MQQIYRRTLMLKCDFKNVAKAHLWSAASAVNYFCKKNYIIDVWQSPEYTFVIYTSDK